MAQYWWEPTMGFADWSRPETMLLVDRGGKPAGQITAENNDKTKFLPPGSERKHNVEVFIHCDSTPDRWRFSWFRDSAGYDEYVCDMRDGYVDFVFVSSIDPYTRNARLQVGSGLYSERFFRIALSGEYSESRTERVRTWSDPQNEPTTWGEEHTNNYNFGTQYASFGVISSDLFLFGFGMGTDGDPAPTGPVTPTQRRSSPLMWGAF